MYGDERICRCTRPEDEKSGILLEHRRRRRAARWSTETDMHKKTTEKGERQIHGVGGRGAWDGYKGVAVAQATRSDEGREEEMVQGREGGRR